MFFIKVSHHVLNIKLKWEYNCHTEVPKWFIIEYYCFFALSRQECYKLKKVPPSKKHKTVSVVHKVPEEQRKRYLFYLLFRTLHTLLRSLKKEGISYDEFTIQELTSKSILGHKLKGPRPKPNCEMILLNCYCSWGPLIPELIHCRGCIHLKCLIRDFTLLAFQEIRTFPAIPTTYRRVAAASCGRVPSYTPTSLNLLLRRLIYFCAAKRNPVFCLVPPAASLC